MDGWLDWGIWGAKDYICLLSSLDLRLSFRSIDILILLLISVEPFD